MQLCILILALMFSNSIIFSIPGSLDQSFNTTGYVITNIASPASTTDIARAVVIDISGNFVIAGTNGIDFAVGRYTSSGRLDTNFGDYNGYATTDMFGSADIAYDVAIDGNQNIVAVGTNGTDFAIARYTSDGVLDTSFGIDGDGRTFTQIGTSTANIAYGVAIDSSNNIVVAGTNGTDFVVARYLGTDGSLDPAFGSGVGYVITSVGATDTAYGVAIQSDGKIVVAGTTTTANNFVIVRYLANGLLDTVANGGSGFNQLVTPGYVVTSITTGTDIAYAVTLQSDGKIVVAGRGGANYAVARYTTAGVLDTSEFASPNGFVITNISGTDIAYAVKIQASNQYIVASGTSGNNFSAARYTTTGALDTTFGGSSTGKVTTNLGGTDIAYGSVIDATGKILLAGTDGTNFALAQYTSAGVLNTAGFGSPNGYVLTNIGTGSIDGSKASAIQPDGKIVTVGVSANKVALARYTVTGALDATFGTGGIVTTALGTTTASIAYGVAIQSNGYIVIAGAAATSGTTPNKFLVARYTPTGALDTTGFNSGGTPGFITTAISGATSVAYGIAMQSDGKIVVCGKSGATATPIFTVARYTSAGILDTATFGSGLGYVRTIISTISIAFSVAITSTGNIVACGQSGTTLALPAFTVAEYTTAGVLNSGSFGTTGSPTGTVRTSIGTTSIGYSVAINSSGNIVVGGTTTTGSVSNFALAEYTSEGILNSESFGVDGTPSGTVTTNFTGTDTGYAVAIQSDDYIILDGVTSGNIGMARYTSAGILDSGFGSAGKVTTVLSSGVETVPMGLFLQPNGRIVTCATTSSLNGDFVTVRYLGNTSPQGCVDVTYQSNGYETYPAGSSSVYNPQVTALQIQPDNSVYVASKDLLTTAQSRLIKLNEDGSTALSSITISQPNVTDLIEDSQKNVLIVGTNATPKGWIRRYTTSGSLIADSTFGSSGLVTETNASSFKRVCEQVSGQIIAMGQGTTATTGVLIAYNALGVINTTGFGSSGMYSLASRTFCDMLIDLTSKIYVAVTGATNIHILRVLADGSGLDTSFGPSSNGYVDTGLATASYGSPSISFDNSGNIIVAAVATATGNIVIQKYLATATSDTPVASGTILQTTSLLTTPVIITQLQCDTNNRPIFTGYSANSMLVGRLNLVSTTYSLDTTFAPYSSCPGILKTAYNDEDPSDSTMPKRVAAAVSIGANGGILFGGYEAINSTTAVSLVARVVGDTTPYGQVNRYPRQTVGGIDQTFGNNGNLSLASIASTGIIKATTVLANGKILVAIDTGINTIIAQLNSDYTLNTTTFGSPSGTGGYITLSEMINPSNLMIDIAGNIYIAGKNNETGAYILFKIAPNGSVITWNASTSIALGRDIREQASGRILCTGNNSFGGLVMGFNPNNGTMDIWFGNNLGTNPGFYQTDTTSKVADIVVANDSEDEFIIAYRDADGHAHVICLEENGSIVDPDFTFGTPIANVSADAQIHLSIDANSKIVVVARNTTGNFIAQRYNANGTNDVGPVTITLANPSTTTLQNMISCSDGSTLILGSNSNGNQIIVARLNPLFAMDLTFNTTGLLQEANLPMTQFYDIDVSSTINNNIIVVGASSTPVPYMTNIYNNVAVTATIQNASALVVPGTIDLTLNSEGSTPGYFDLQTDLGTTQFAYSQAKSLELNIVNGTYYIGADNGTNTQITSLNGYTDTQLSGFGSAGVITISGKAAVSYLYLDTAGYLNVVGGSGASGSNAGWVCRYDGTTGIPISGFSVTDVLDVNKTIQEQTTTRLLVAGQEDGIGTIIAYNSVTGAVDESFGVSGRYSIGSTSIINNMIVTSVDNSMYIVFNDSSNNAIVQKISDDGVTIDNPIWSQTLITSNSTINSNSYIALDTNGDVIAISVDTVTPQIILKKYNKITGETSATLNLTNTITGFTSPYITSIVVDSNNKIIFSGYDNLANDTAFVARVFANMSGLDTTFNPTGSTAGIQPYKISSTSTVRAWNDVRINGQGRILTSGFVNVSGNDTPYFIRFNGDPYASQVETILPTGGQGTLDLTFNATGTLNLNSLDALLDNTSAAAMLTLSTDVAYIVFDNGTTASYMIRMVNGGDTLDSSSYNSGALYGMPAGFAHSAPQGVNSVMQDGVGRILLTGTDGSGGWIQRYVAGNSGNIDTTFGVSGIISGQMSDCAIVGQQTLGRYIVAGTRAGNGVLRAYTLSGVLDTTFNATGPIPGEYNIGIANGLYDLVIDVYDRIYIAYKNTISASPNYGINIARLASNGYLDSQFNNTGIILNAIIHADDASQIRIVIDAFSNIVVAAHINDGVDKIAIVAYDTAGVLVYSQLNMTNFTAPVLTDLTAKTGGRVELSGYQSGNNPMWVARILPTGTPDLLFGVNVNGIMLFDVATASQTARILEGISVRSNGDLSEIGYEQISGIKTPYLARSYDFPYQASVAITPNQKPIGTVDQTLGKSGVPVSIVRMYQEFKKYKQEITNIRDRTENLRQTTVNGIIFFASPGADAACNQVAQAIAMQDINTYVIALDGATSDGGSSKIFINEFDVNGNPVLTFNSTGQVTLPHNYENEYVRDIVTFTTSEGINKVILAGYMTNATLGITGSVIWQYNLSAVALDTEFGGFNENPIGIAFGDGKQINVIGQQTNSRIIAGGLDQNNIGLLLGYTATGKLDTSFGNDGYQSSNTGTTGIYTHAIDPQNRIVIAYNDGSNNVAVARFLADGSGLDMTFGESGLVVNKITGISGNSNIKVVVDGNGNVVVAAVNNSGLDTVLKQYTSSGIINTTLTVTSENLGGVTSLTLARLLVNSNGNLIVVAWDNATNNQIIIFQTIPDLTSLDEGFNNTGTPGYLKYIVSTGASQISNDALIQPDGRIVVVGSED